MFKPSKLSLALLSCGLISASALAQSAEQANTASQQTANNAQDDQIEVIEVTGFRKSLIDSINAKRFADTVTEQLSADDLGALPDVSMADALTRLPGISAVRTGGQAAEINIRGMDGGFVFSTLNGREQVSTSGSRSIEFDQYPSELITEAAVYKSPKASLIEGGVAGTVELKTASPLSIDQDHKFNINARGMYNDRASEVQDANEFGHRLSLSYQGKFLDETLGVALGYARLYQPSVATQFIGFAYNGVKDIDLVDGDTDGPIYDDGSANPERDIDKEYISEGFELQHLGGEETRNGYVGAIEWAPSDVFKLRADAFVSKFDSKTFARGFRVKFGGENAAYANPVIAENAMVGGTINRTTKSFTRVETVNDDNQDFDEIQNYGLNLQWQITERLTADLDLSYSNATNDFRNGLLWALVAEDANAETPVFDTNVSLSYLLNGLDLPDVGFNQADAFTDTNRLMVSKYGIYPFQNEDELKAVRLDLQYDLDNDFFSSIEFGARYSEREYSNDRSLYQYGNDGAFSSREAPLQLTDDMVEVVNWEGDFSYFPSYLAIDLDSALAAWFPNGIPQPVQTWGANSEGVIDNNSSWSVLQSGDVFEKVVSAYVMANIDTEIGDIPVTGNIGIRMVDTDQSSTVYEDVGGDVSAGATPIVDQVGLVNSNYAFKRLGLKYTDYLPSINLNFRVTDNDQIRFAAAKVMSRPEINRLVSNLSTNINDDGEISGNSDNNPFLKPFYANQYDISYERYFADTDGAFVAAFFYKDIESFVQTLPIYNFDFSANGFYVPETIEDELSGVPVTVDPVGTYTTAINNEEGGSIKGIELAYTQIFSFLPDLWSGLGLNVSYSYTKSEVEFFTDLGGQTRTQSLPGLSENVLNATLFWNYKDFETRLNARYRSEFVSEQWGVNEQVVNFDDEIVVDMQASYDVTEQLSVLFQVNNLTDEPTQSYFGSKQFTGTTQFFGRQFYLGANYAF
ncbi:TonB-dependent receptor [Thalassotalea eurytherma]|uniref:TonB-dependent receptor n=1 Tax=Thalassotalea eurytherma TaxID=1144278 RepID=A0ABQ6H973_9GAMM|nr:TonB-dependent receptor [Thalassotalea eurytherma]GLX83327.1 TonB-dependent receptor [Thalassotalea eurytherma]